MRPSDFVRCAVILAAVALPACGGGGMVAQTPAGNAVSSAVLPQTLSVKPSSLRGSVVNCLDCTFKPGATPTPATLTTSSVRGLHGFTPPTPVPDP